MRLIKTPQIRRTQKAIKTALTERWYAWEDARLVAERDPEVDLHTNLETPAYKPKDLFAVSKSKGVYILNADMVHSLHLHPVGNWGITRLQLVDKHKSTIP